MRALNHFGRRVSVVLLALAAAVPSQAQAQDLTASERQRLNYETRPATVLIRMTVAAQITVPTDGGQLQLQTSIANWGSGWIATEDGFVVTNAHVVQLYEEENETQLGLELLYKALAESGYFDRSGLTTEAERQQATVDIFENATVNLLRELDVILQNGRSFPANIRRFSPPFQSFTGRLSTVGWRGSTETGQDIAVLKADGARDWPTLQMAPPDDAQVGDEVFVQGFPDLFTDDTDVRNVLNPSFTDGTINSVKVSVEGADVIQTNADIHSGNSGGPVMNSRGQVIGIATAGTVDSQTGAAVSGFNFVVPIRPIADLLRAEAAPVGTESMFDRTWDRALDQYYGGQFSAAIETFDETLRILPDFPDATGLRRRAMTARDNGEDAPPAVTEADVAVPAAPAATTPAAVPASTDDGGFPMWLLALLGGGAVLVVLGLAMRGGSPQPAAAPAARSAAPAASSASAANMAATVATSAAPRQLTVTAGPLSGNTFKIQTGGTRIGRDASMCQIVLSESSVSREHAVITTNGSSLQIKNLSGTNPTYVNDRSIQEATLKAGDQVKIGDSIFKVEA